MDVVVTSADLLNGVVIAIVGMGVVFIFLMLMIYSVKVSAWVLRLIEKRFPEEAEAVSYQPRQAALPSSGTNEEEAVAVAIAAVKALVKG